MLSWDVEIQGQLRYLSTKLLVGISVKPICRKISRYSARTLSMGCRQPASAVLPRASKLSFLNGSVFHDPSASMSDVSSVLGLTITSAKFGPLLTLMLFTTFWTMSLRFFSTSTSATADRSIGLARMACSPVWTVSTMVGV